MSSLKDFGFEDIKVIGRGQYGKAHLVRNDKDSLYYIAKTIELACLSKKEQQTATQEVDLLRSLNHPCIVQYKDNFFMSDTLVIIMEYCEGGDLQTYIKERQKQKQRIREDQVMNWFVQVLQALQYIHDKRILHRDLKSSNLFLMKSMKVVKLGDFGISRVLEGSIEAAITVVGTPYYMSPEVCENKPYTFKSDVWSLGCVLYELCMLKHAFAADNLLGLVYKIVSDKYEPIPKMYSPDLNMLIQRMLEKNADNRPSVPDLFSDSYLRSFMAEYVRTHGQSTRASSSSRPPGSGGSAPRGSTTSSLAQAGGLAPGPPGSASGRRAPGARSPGGEATLPGSSGGGTGDARAPRLKATRREDRTSAGLRAAGGGVATPGARHVGGTMRQERREETPKEAAQRRKREAADRQAVQLAAAAKQAPSNRLAAKQMKETEFQSTRLGPSAMSVAAQAANTRAKASLSASPTSPGGSQALEYEDDDDDGSYTEDSESAVEEILEEDCYSTDDQYEDDFVSEEDESEGAGGSDREGCTQMVHMDSEYGLAPCNREEQDLRRVMANYEHDISRTAGGQSPTRRSPVHAQPAAAAPAAAPAAASPSGSQPALGGQIMDMKSRAGKLREDLVAKMGAELFQQSFDYLLKARTEGEDEGKVKKELGALMGKENYKRFGFDVDQLVFSAMR